MQRTILHSDMNSFYASVEMMLNPSLRGKAVAVCGSTENRHGIVLAKSELAKKAGVKTGMVNWEAKQRCPDLILVKPQYDQYLKYSAMAREIYSRYTDLVEPYGMDECWLDCGGSVHLYGSELTLADSIRKTMREELGLTVSIGVSYNKILAKLGSDMKKPNAVTVIAEGDLESKIWPLPAGDLLYVGRATGKRLSTYGIHTIGELANANPDFLKQLFGVNGIMLWRFANGKENSPVTHTDSVCTVKSVGHGITCVADLENAEEVWRVMLELSQDIGHKLRLYKLAATGVQITVKDNTLAYKQYQAPLPTATQSPMEIALKARELFNNRYSWPTSVRSVTVRAINLVQQEAPQQLDIFTDPVKQKKRESLEDTVENIRKRFGKRAIYQACLFGDLKMPPHSEYEIVMPNML